MVYKHYNRFLFIRILLIVLIPLFIGIIIAESLSPFFIVLLSVIEVILIYELINFLNSTNRQISYFIQAIKNDDTTLRFPIKTGSRIINDLHKSLNDLNVILQQTKVKSQIKEHYFSEIIQNIGVGIMIYNEKGFVTQINPAALELLGVQNLTHLLQIDRIDPKFKVELEAVSHLGKQVIILRKANEQIHIITRCSVINLEDENVKLITLQDIRGELERKELDSWVKLIRVLSHEIMNSLAPVTSISQSLLGIWKEKIETNPALLDDEAVNSTLKGLEVISERGEGLIRFVQSYRMLTKVPVPQISEVSMKNLFDRLSILVSPMKEEYGISIKFNQPEPDFNVQIDEQLIVQIVINLVKNAAEALTGILNPYVEISCNSLFYSGNEISVKDNGPGIPKEIIDEIFIPFFTTKENGTGIGLSHSRQIMRAHGGTISCISKPGETIFKLQW